MAKVIRHAFRPGDDGFVLVEEDGKTKKLLKHNIFNRFNPSILGLGDIWQESEIINAICAIFDLQGFTNLCKQIDPQLSVPFYLNGFLEWIFGAIRAETVSESLEEGVWLRHTLPICAKFLGDGLLILWDTNDMPLGPQHNLIYSAYSICMRYFSEFLPDMRAKVCDPPDALRCGLTKGTVYSIGDGIDFVGPCINLASRLQKLPGAKFAFARRGFNPEIFWEQPQLDGWILKKVAIRGMGNEELIYLRKEDFDKMNEGDQDFYRNP